MNPRGMVVVFLRDVKSNPTDVLNAHFSSISEESRIGLAEELLPLLSEGVKQPQTDEDRFSSGNIGVITLGCHYAYPLLLTVLGWWVDAVYNTAMANGELTPAEKEALYQRLRTGIDRWDWMGLDKSRYGYLQQLLVPPPQEDTRARSSILQRMRSLILGS